MRAPLTVLVLGVLSAACVGDSAFHCDETQDGGPRPCGALGVCFAGACGQPEPQCPSGHRYGGIERLECMPCAHPGDPCCGDACDDPGLVCLGEGRKTCVACGEVGEPCCSEGRCADGALCSGGQCVACGGLGQPCCERGEACGTALTCAGAACTCAASLQASCVRKADGTLWCWGPNGNGELGIGSTQSPDGCFTHHLATCAWNPQQVKSAAGPFAHVEQVVWAASARCARTSEGAVWCWGSNQMGQLGIGPASAPESCFLFPFTTGEPCSTLPLQVVDEKGAPLSGVAQLSAGGEWICARQDSGAVRCWGANHHIAWGHDSCAGGHHGGGLPCARSPVTVPDELGQPFQGAVDLAVGSAHACLVRQGGTVWCFGVNDMLQLGTVAGSLESCEGMPCALYPRQLSSGAQPFSGVSRLVAGTAHTCALKQDGTVFCWGDNPVGQLGNGSNVASAEPVRVIDGAGQPLADVVELAAGGDTTCARRANGTVLCWGGNSDGQVGDGSAEPRASATEVVLAPGAPFTHAVELALEPGKSCARRSDGSLWCWGIVDTGFVDVSATPLSVRFTCP